MAQVVDKQNLRDARHAHNLYTKGGFDWAPKVKFLYHVSFELSDEARQFASTTSQYLKVVNVLVKSADLPSYSAQIETKKQYNRIKHLQTRIDYDPVNIVFHDDNVGITSKLLEEYYRYYYKDGGKFDDPGNPTDFGPRDKYKEKVPRYGLDDGPATPFFKYIKIFQLARQEWTGYTLVNPLVEKWQHDAVDSSEGAGITQNALTILYESVLYSRGQVSEQGDPPGFAAVDTGYDFTDSYLKNGPIYSVAQNIRLQEPEEIPSDSGPLVRFSNDSIPGADNSIISNLLKNPGGFPNILFPKPATSPISSVLSTSNDRTLPASTITNVLRNNQSAARTFTNQAVLTGQVSGFAVTTLNAFNALPSSQKTAITNNLIDAVDAGNKKLQQIGSNVIKGL